MPTPDEAPKILKPGQVDVRMNPVVIPIGEKLQMQIATPEGSRVLVIIQAMDYNWEKDELLLAAGQVDLIAEAKKGQIMSVPKGIIK